MFTSCKWLRASNKHGKCSLYNDLYFKIQLKTILKCWSVDDECSLPFSILSRQFYVFTRLQSICETFDYIQYVFHFKAHPFITQLWFTNSIPFLYTLLLNDIILLEMYVVYRCDLLDKLRLSVPYLQNKQQQNQRHILYIFRLS